MGHVTIDDVVYSVCRFRGKFRHGDAALNRLTYRSIRGWRMGTSEDTFREIRTLIVYDFSAKLHLVRPKLGLVSTSCIDKRQVWNFFMKETSFTVICAM
jgi:hypothetical protein